MDHLNRDKLDNRRENLRVVTAGVNARNRENPPASQNPGVTWDSKNRRWCAWGYVGGRTIWLGRHLTEELAVAAVERWKGSQVAHS